LAYPEQTNLFPAVRMSACHIFIYVYFIRTWMHVCIYMHTHVHFGASRAGGLGGWIPAPGGQFLLGSGLTSMLPGADAGSIRGLFNEAGALEQPNPKLERNKNRTKTQNQTQIK
jgi:hypothetical protein